MEKKLDAKGLLQLFKDAFADWNEDKAPTLAAALAYFTAFSLAPLLLIAISIASIFYGNANQEARNQITKIIPGGGDAIVQLLDATNKSGGTGIAAVIGFVILLFGASGFFAQLQDSLNTVWEVKPKPNQGFMAIVKQRFLSFTMVLGTGFLLLVSLIASSALAVVIGYFKNFLPGADFVWTIVTYVVNIALVTGVFALIFKFIPEVKIKWGDVVIGALVTAILFTLGQLLLNLYLGSQQNAYGAFGSLIVLLLWVFYSSQILFFGAEFTQVYAQQYGSHVEPAENAVAMTEDDRANQGMLPKGSTGQNDKSATGSVPATTGAPALAVQTNEGPKPGAVTTAVGFAIGWLLGRQKR